MPIDSAPRHAAPGQSSVSTPAGMDAGLVHQAAHSPRGIIAPSDERPFIYFGNLYPHEPQFQSGLFRALALHPKFEFDIAHDASQPLPFADGSIKGFQSQDVFEHIPYEKVSGILDEVYRCLQPGGVFRLSMPDYNSPLLRNRSVYDSYGRILCDAAMGGSVSGNLSGSLDVNFVGNGDAHIWFPTYSKTLELIVSSRIRLCTTIEFHHYWADSYSYRCVPFEPSVMPVHRAPPADMRADGKPISIVVDFVK
jgi:SAM-dependent methyltransferase